jgi:hypothetical protein
MGLGYNFAVNYSMKKLVYQRTLVPFLGLAPTWTLSFKTKQTGRKPEFPEKTLQNGGPNFEFSISKLKPCP